MNVAGLQVEQAIHMNIFRSHTGIESSPDSRVGQSMTLPYFMSIYNSIRLEEKRSREMEVKLNDDKEGSGEPFVGYLQALSIKTVTYSNRIALFAYLAHAT